jgi:RNA polymerase sigma-70 factor (ECF subfamily)
VTIVDRSVDVTQARAVTMDLIDRARSGDEEAFGQLVDPFRRELHVHCYRMLGSLHDAEDLMQETLLTAWRSLGGFEGRASVRTWLYRVATSRCLNALRARRRRPQAAWPVPDVDPPAATRLGEVVWLEPYPDVLLEGPADQAPGPEARYEATEAVSLAFVTALQLLPPRQRAVLVLRDVLGYKAGEAAVILDASEESVTSALKRARATLRRELSTEGREPPPAAASPTEQRLLARLARALEAGDVDGVVSLLTDDVWLTMPPLPLEYQGRDIVGRFYAAVAFRRGRTYRVVATRANGQPAFGLYVRDPHGGVLHANGLLVLTLAGDRICTMTRFDNSVLARFGLPRTLPA